MGGFLMRLFGVGSMPPELSQASQQGALLAVERVKLKASGSMRTPRRTSSGFSATHGGAVVILPDRVLASFARYVLIDDQPSAAPPADASTECSIDGSGIRLHIEIPPVIEGGTGYVDIELRISIPADVLDALPLHRWQGRIATADPQLMLQRI